MRSDIDDLRTIEDVRSQFGLTARALRFYEQKQLISAVRIDQRRYYDSRAVDRLRLIMACKLCGLPLSEIALFLDIMDAPLPNSAKVGQLSEVLDSHIQVSQEQQKMLQSTISESEKLREKLQASNDPFYLMVQSSHEKQIA